VSRRIRIRTTARDQLVDITDEVRDIAAASGVAVGTLTLFSLHTTCALTVNEGFDPDVERDIVAFLRKLVPHDHGFRHGEGNSDSHIKVALFGPSITLIIEDGALLLGRWQRVFLAEWDGPRSRDVAYVVNGGIT
jgi:secondary thiamine-phosphate synthase enzyme